MAGISTVDAVVTHVPGFVRNSPSGIEDSSIQAWIDARWSEIQAVLTRRALTLPVSGTDGYGVLELLNRVGAAADLAAAISVVMSPGTRWAVEKNLRDDYIRQLGRLDAGELDKLLNPDAKTEDVTPRVQAIGGGEDGMYFSKDMVF